MGGQRSCQDLGDVESGVGTSRMREIGGDGGLGAAGKLPGPGGCGERDGNKEWGKWEGMGRAGSCQDLGDRESGMGTSRMGEIGGDGGSRELPGPGGCGERNRNEEWGK